MQIQLTVNGSPLITLKTEHATAYDHLNFIDTVINALQKDKAFLEKEANNNGRTIDTDLVETFGMLPINSTNRE